MVKMNKINFSKWLETLDFENLFGSDWKKNRPKVVKQDPPKVIPYTITLYRGSREELQREGDQLVLDPNKGEQGLIWFTHPFISHYNPIQYAASHGDYFITYPLKCRKHIQRTHYDDGRHYDNIPQVIIDKTNPYENCRFYLGIELPQGWVFSYKAEKFIGCSKKLWITKDMIQKSSEVWNED
jgi:hypothetical protein